jgi:hypothetical protein
MLPILLSIKISKNDKKETDTDNLKDFLFHILKISSVNQAFPCRIIFVLPALYVFHVREAFMIQSL